MAEYKKICKFEATRNPSRWIITTLMDLESLNAAVKLMFDSTSELWPAVRKTGLWKNKFYFDFKFGVCEQVLAERVNRYNAQVHEETANDGLEKANVEAVVQIYSRNRYLLKTKCYTQVLCEDDAMRLLKWLNNPAALKTTTSRTPLLRDGDAMVKAIVAAIDVRRKDESISEVAKRVAADALTPFGAGARSPMYQNLVSLHMVVNESSNDFTETDKIYNVHYLKDPIWSANAAKAKVKAAIQDTATKIATIRDLQKLAKVALVVPTVSIKPAIESEPKIVLKPSEVSIKSEAVLIQVSQNVKAKSLLSRIMH